MIARETLALEAVTGPRDKPDSALTNDAAASTALPRGVSIRTVGSQRCAVVTGEGVTLEGWEIQIPVIALAAGLRLIDTELNAKGILPGAAKWKNLTLGYDPVSGKLAEGAGALLDHCLVSYDGGPTNPLAASALIQAGMYLDAAKFTEKVSLTLRGSQVRRSQAAQVQVYGADVDIERSFFGGFGMHPTDTAVHSEALWMAYGALRCRNSLFDHAEAMECRLAKTWTGFVYANARFRRMSLTLRGNVFRNPGAKSGPAIQLGVHSGSPGSIGVIDIAGNTIERFGKAAHFALSNISASQFERLCDNVDLQTGKPITAPAEVGEPAKCPTCGQVLP